MKPHLELSPRSFPARIAELGFTALVPNDWVSHDATETDVDFDDPTRFTPLAILTAPQAAIVLAFAARPAYDDGTLHDWAQYNLDHNQLAPRAIGHHRAAGVGAVVGEAVQPSDLGPMVVRFAFFEDGGRLVNITLTAPEVFADTVARAWFAMLQSFALESPKGSRFPAEAHADDTPATPIPEPWLEPRPAGPAARPYLVDSETGEPMVIGIQYFPLPKPSKTKRTRLFDFALSDNGIALDVDHEVNVKLAKQGVGQIPEIAGYSETLRQTTVSAIALGANFDVPFGWHVLDDGQRTLVFEPSGKIQISLDLLPCNGRKPKAILDDIEAEMRRDYENPEFIRIRDGQLEALAARRLADGGQDLGQTHMLFPGPDDSMVLHARVTATPEQASNASNLAELILRSCVFPEIPEEEESEGATDEDFSTEAQALSEVDEAVAEAKRNSFYNRPTWWYEAMALEVQGDLEAAEAHIKNSCPAIGFAQATASLYRERMNRLKAKGDKKGALAAFLKSSEFIQAYAGFASSGGEGAALSLERDEFRAELVAEYGSDPED